MRTVGTAFACILVFALLRGVLRYAEQASNHYIAFKLLAPIRDKVFGALRRLTPAKLEGRDRGDLISLITADIEALEVFYAHTISAHLHRVHLRHRHDGLCGQLAHPACAGAAGGLSAGGGPCRCGAQSAATVPPGSTVRHWPIPTAMCWKACAA